MNWGDVVLVRFPHPSGLRGKKRPAVVVQADVYQGTVSTLVVAQVTKNLTMAADPACLLIDVTTPEGKATGLVRDSVISCLLLATVDADTVQLLGALSPPMMAQLSDCLKAGLGIVLAVPLATAPAISLVKNVTMRRPSPTAHRCWSIRIGFPSGSISVM